MAYVTKENVIEKREKLKELWKKYGMTWTLRRDNYTSLDYTIRKGPIDFWSCREQVNVYWINEERQNNPIALEYLKQARDILNEWNHDNSDAMTDYFDVGWYIHINIGQYNKPYVLK